MHTGNATMQTKEKKHNATLPINCSMCIVNTTTSQLAWMKQVNPWQEQPASCFRREMPRLIMLDLFLKTFCEVFQKPKPTILGDPRNYLQDEHDPPTNPDQPVLSCCIALHILMNWVSSQPTIVFIWKQPNNSPTSMKMY